MKKPISTIRHSLNHLGAAVAGKVVPLASIFVFSHHMSVADFGVVSLFSSYIWILAITFSLNLHTALGRYAYQPGADLPAFLGTALIAIGSLVALGSVGVLAGLPHVASALGLPAAALPLLLVVVLGQIAESMYIQFAVYQQTSDRLLRALTGKAVATFAVAVALLLALDSDKYLAVLGADALTSLLLAILALTTLGRGARWRLSGEHFRYMARYSMPLIPYMLSLTLLAQFDRVMIDHFYGKEATGLYSLAFNVGMLFALAMTAILNALHPRFFADMNGAAYGSVASDSRGVFCVAYAMAASLVLFGPVAVSNLVPTAYADALPLIPVIAVGGLCSVLFQIWGRVIHFSHRTHVLSVIAVAATTVKLGLNAWLLPRLGYQAAALTTVVAYLGMALLCVWAIRRRLRHVRLNVGFEMALLTALAAAAALFHWLPVAFQPALAPQAVALGLLLWPARKPLVTLWQTRGRTISTTVVTA